MDQNSWYSHTCYTFRASSDMGQYVVPFKVGTQLSMRAGYKIWASTTATTPISYGQNSQLMKYTIVDTSSSFALAASAVSFIVMALVL